MKTKFISLLAVLMLLCLLVPEMSMAGSVSLIDRIESALRDDGSFTPDEIAAYVAGFKAELANYSFDILREKNKAAGAEVLLSVVSEGSFDNLPVERVVPVASAAYVAIRRGSTPEVVEGIALYGFRKKISADAIEVWANGYNDCIKAGVPADIAEDLVFNAAEHGWDDRTYNELKWGLVKGAKAGYDMEDFQAYMVGNFLKGRQGPGTTVGNALRYFRGLGGKKPEVPPYKGSFIPKYERAAMEEKAVAPPATGPAPREAAPAKDTASKKAAGEPSRQAPAASRETPVRGTGFFAKLENSYRDFLGTPYVWGGETKRGTDCSGFVQSVFASMGIKLPRVSHEQWKVGQDVPRRDLKKGDLVFFRTIGNRISHVGIFADRTNMTFIHASSSKGVSFAELDSKYYSKRYAGARRVIPSSVARLMPSFELMASLR